MSIYSIMGVINRLVTATFTTFSKPARRQRYALQFKQGIVALILALRIEDESGNVISPYGEIESEECRQCRASA